MNKGTTTKQRLDLRRRTSEVEIHARTVRRRRLAAEAKEVINLVKSTGIMRHQSVVLLVFDTAEGDIMGHTNVDPILAALALVDYLDGQRASFDRPSKSAKGKKAKRRA